MSFNFGTDSNAVAQFQFGAPGSRSNNDGNDSDDERVDLGPSAITDRIYIGTRFDAALPKLKENGITHVLCCTSGSARVPLEGITRVLMPMSDFGESDIFDDVLAGAVPFIKDALLEEGSKVLVHCTQGINRSPTAVITYLMAEKRMPLRQAYDLVAKGRPQLCLHDNYVEQLRKLDLHLFGEASTEPGDIVTARQAIKEAMAAYAPQP